MISEGDHQMRVKHFVDETKEEENDFDTHQTTTSCSTDKENQDINSSNTKVLPSHSKSHHKAVSQIKENGLPLIINGEHAKNPLSEVKGSEFNFTFNPKLA